MYPYISVHVIPVMSGQVSPPNTTAPPGPSHPSRWTRVLLRWGGGHVCSFFLNARNPKANGVTVTFRWFTTSTCEQQRKGNTICFYLVGRGTVAALVGENCTRLSGSRGAQLGGSIITVMMDSLFDGRIHYQGHDGQSLWWEDPLSQPWWTVSDGRIHYPGRSRWLDDPLSRSRGTASDWRIPYHGREGQPLIGGSIITVERDSLWLEDPLSRLRGTVSDWRIHYHGPDGQLTQSIIGWTKLLISPC